MREEPTTEDVYTEYSTVLEVHEQTDCNDKLNNNYSTKHKSLNSDSCFLLADGENNSPTKEKYSSINITPENYFVLEQSSFRDNTRPGIETNSSIRSRNPNENEYFTLERITSSVKSRKCEATDETSESKRQEINMSDETEKGVDKNVSTTPKVLSQIRKDHVTFIDREEEKIEVYNTLYEPDNLHTNEDVYNTLTDTNCDYDHLWSSGSDRNDSHYSTFTNPKPVDLDIDLSSNSM